MSATEPLEPPPAYSPARNPPLTDLPEQGPSRGHLIERRISTTQGTWVYSEHDNKSILTATPTQMTFQEPPIHETPSLQPIQIPTEPPIYPPTSPMSLQAKSEVELGFQAQLFARCARGEHDVVKRYGKWGIISAVVLFPIGFVCLVLDVKKRCTRCGLVL